MVFQIEYFYFIKNEGEIDFEEMFMQCELLVDYNVKFFGDVFEKIYIEYNGQVFMQYGFNVSVKELFFKCLKLIEDVLLS